MLMFWWILVDSALGKCDGARAQVHPTCWALGLFSTPRKPEWGPTVQAQWGLRGGEVQPAKWASLVYWGWGWVPGSSPLYPAWWPDPGKLLRKCSAPSPDKEHTTYPYQGLSQDSISSHIQETEFRARTIKARDSYHKTLILHSKTFCNRKKYSPL